MESEPSKSERVHMPHIGSSEKNHLENLKKLTADATNNDKISEAEKRKILET